MTTTSPITVRLAPCLCPTCGGVLDAATSAGHDRKPRPGDITLCITCGDILEFTPELTVRRPLADRLATIFADDPGLGQLALSLQNRLRTHPVSTKSRPAGRA